VISVIVPARNEEACLGPCLASLVSQTGVAFEIIVVDDGSADRTRAIAQSFPTVRVIEPPPLPPGWTGKNNAVAAGAREAKGKWLLFTDADTVHKPGSLARAIVEAEQHHTDLLSYSPEQEVHGFWERAVMPVIFAELARKYPPSAVSDSSKNLAAANGQYLLISRAAYDAVGGHAAIAQSLLEDVALARAVRDASLRIRFRYAGDAVRTRMYRGFRQLREGWTKNLILLFPSAGALALLRALEFLFVIVSLVIAMLMILAGDWRHSVLFFVPAVLTVMRIASAHFSWSSNLLGIVGLPVFSYLLLRSKFRHAVGAVTWKGRTYTGAAGIKPVS
jgi:ABC-type multidrug transport system fused ATPase/permease subunit